MTKQAQVKAETTLRELTASEMQQAGGGGTRRDPVFVIIGYGGG